MTDTPRPKPKAKTRSPRRGRAWWQWALGVGLLGAAAFFTFVRYVATLEPVSAFQPAKPIPLRLPDGIRPADRVAAEHGALRGSNLLLVTLDTTRADRLGCYGNPAIQTPNTDRLAREGVLFTQAVTPTPVTLPAHSSMMTGLSPLRHGARVNALSHLDDRNVTLAEVLRGAGYQTAGFVSAFVLDPQFGIAQGFDHYDATVAHGSDFWQAVSERRGDATCDLALQWLAERGPQPFFLWVHFFDPHWAYDPPEPFKEQYKRMPYDGEIAFADAQLGRLLQFLDDRGLSNDTLVVLAGDHGEGLFQHDEATHGCLVYDSTLHVPLVLRCGTRVGGGVHVDATVCLTDILPTTLALLGVPAPAGLDGIDLTQPHPGARTLFVETFEALAEYGWAPLLGVRDGTRKYVYGPEPELFDLASDPYEERNLIASGAQAATELHRQLTGFFGEDLEAAGTLHAVEQLTPAEIAKLESLGYIAGLTGEQIDTAARPDPRRMMPLLRRVSVAFQPDREDWLDRAIEDLEAIVRDHPDFYLAHRELGTAYAVKGELERGAMEFQKCLELRPNNIVPLHKLATIRDRQKDYDAAITYYHEVLRLYPDHFPTLDRLGRLLLERGALAEGTALLVKAHELLPDDEPTTLTAAQALVLAGRGDEAGAILTDALAAEPASANVRNRLARVLKDQQRFDEALRILREGLRLTPDQHEFAANLALTLLAMPDPDGRARTEAGAIMLRVCERTEFKDPGFVHVLAKAYAAAGHPEEAAALAAQAEQLARAAELLPLAQAIAADAAQFRAAAQASSRPAGPPASAPAHE